MEELLGFTSIPAIVIICLFIAHSLKTTTKLRKKYLPVICGFIGGVLGVVAMFIMPGFPANDYITATAIGIVSGFAATGVNQVKKQLSNGADK